jgi:hypothetical protein
MHEKAAEQQKIRIQVRVSESICTGAEPWRFGMHRTACAKALPRGSFDLLHMSLQDLEHSLKQLEGRCGELRDAATGHEHRAKEASAEVSKSKQIIERLTADLQTSKDKLKRKQVIIVRQVRWHNAP